MERSVPVEGEDGGSGSVTLVVEPLPGQEPDLPYLIVFRDAGPGRTGEVPPDGAPGTASLAVELDREIRDTGEQLQSFTEEHETALEELRSSNEGFCQVSCQQVSPVGCGRDDLRLRGLQDAQHRHAPAQEAQAAREGGDVLVAAGARAEVVAQLVVASTEPGR